MRSVIKVNLLNRMLFDIDAMPCSTVSIKINDNRINYNINKDMILKIEDDLDIDEKISILFLMINDYTHSFQEIYALLQKHKERNIYVLTEFIEKHPENWQNKLLECICVIQNRQIIRKLGIPYKELELLYWPQNRSCSRYLNIVAKCLYLLCEAFSEDKVKLLLQYVRNDLTEYERNLEDINFLELHMLYWMEVNYIPIQSDGKMELRNLLKHLKRFEDMELIYEDLKRYERHQNVLDLQHMSSVNGAQLQGFSMREGTDVFSNIKGQEGVKELNKGLCIIISQMIFTGGKFETRFGTLADCIQLSKTFKGFGFNVVQFENLKKDEMVKKLEDIPKEFGTDYDCIFVCILSHGCKGGIISSDEQEINIETIEHKFCCTELKDVIKIVIIQACQGKVTGQANDALAVDGPMNRNVLAYTNFCVFMSTMQGFVSVRHKEEGSWFIQELCSILQNGKNKITFSETVRRTIQSVMKKRGKLNGGTDSIAQLPELRTCRLVTDFQFPEYRA